MIKIKKLKFAILGCGRISKKHIDALKKNYEQAELVALSDLIIKKAEIRKDEYLQGIPFNNVNIYTDYLEMLKNEEIDVISICTESGYHYEHTLNALNYGINVIVEKPMAMKVSEAEEMIDLAQKKNKYLGVVFQNRYNEPVVKMREALESGKFGKIVNITARILWNRNQDYYNLDTWRGTKDLDGGALMNQCIHNIDLLQWMSTSRPIRIKHEIGTFLRDIEMEDFGAVIIRFENDIIGIVEGSVCVYPTNLEETLSVFGEKGTMVIGGLALNKLIYANFEDHSFNSNGLDTKIDSVYGNGHNEYYRNYIYAVINNKEIDIDGLEGIKALKIICEIYNKNQ